MPTNRRDIANNVGKVEIMKWHNEYWNSYDFEQESLLFSTILNALLIPVIPAGHSGAFRPPIPIYSGRLFRGIPATPSERSDAGAEILFR
jgi:hypothetical protein